MAINLGLGVTGQRNFQSLLASHHWLDVRLQLLTLDHVAMGEELSVRFLDGQVTVDSDADVSRSLDLDLIDPTRALHLDSKAPDDGAVFADRMLQVRYAIVDPTWTNRYSVPVFTGPLTKLERSGAIVKLEAQGKEVFGLSEAWNEKTFKKGYKVTAAIRYILLTMMGESAKRIRIPDRPNKLPRNVSVGGDKLPWQVAKELAASIGFHLFYDALGICQMRRYPTARVFTFRDGAGGTIKTEPDAGFSLENTVNAVEVWGKKPAKPKKNQTAKKRPHARVVADRSHPLSPWSLGRSSGPRYLPLTIEDDGVTSNAEAMTRAKRALKNGLLESVDVAYDALVIPHLEELDVVRTETQIWSGNHRLRQFAIPLTAGGQMSVGYVKNVKPNKARIRLKRKQSRKVRSR